MMLANVTRPASVGVATLLSIGCCLLLSIAPAAAQQKCISVLLSDTENYYKTRPKQKYARVFALEYEKTSKTILVNTAGEGIDYAGGGGGDGKEQELDVVNRYFFRQCGSNLQPGPDHVPNFLVETPVEHVVITATTQLGYLMSLNKIDTAKVYIGDPQYITDRCFRDRIKDGKVLVYEDQKEFADALQDPANEQPCAPANDEAEKEAEIECLILSELKGSTRTLMFGPAGTGWGGDARFIHNANQTSLLPVMDVLAYKEKSSQGIFEWNEVYGAIYSMEKEARRHTFIKEKRFECLAKKVEKKWNVDIFNSEKPKVCWAYYLPDNYGYGVGWVWADKCKGNPDTDEYYCKFAKTAHVELVTGEGDIWSENIYDDQTTAAMFEDCYAIIYANYYRDLVDDDAEEEQIKDTDTAEDIAAKEERGLRRQQAAEVLQNTPAWEFGRVYDFTLSGKSNWFEYRLVHYDRAQEDFMSISDRHSKMKFYKRLFFRRLGPNPEPEGVDDECKIITTIDDSGRRVQTSCATIATRQECHKYPECKKTTKMCELQEQCKNSRSFSIPFTKNGLRRRKRVSCRKVTRNPGQNSNGRPSCDDELVANKCALKCRECCPQLG